MGGLPEASPSLDAIEKAARSRALTVLGGFHPDPEDGAPEGYGTLLLLGPDEPEFWSVFRTSPEMQDGARDPLDRWSRRVATGLARDFGGRAIFPFDGPPWAPFQRWALRSQRCHASPVNLLVHDRLGLFVSFRAALALPGRIAMPAAPSSPCADCARPCLTACPVSALGPRGYAVAACKSHISGPDEANCRDRGCAVRRSCPVSARHPRPEAQSAFHMGAFLR